MAFTSQDTSSLADAVSKLNTFLAANGWSTHHVPASGEFAAWKNPSGSIWITCALQWDTGTPQYCGVYQWHGQAYDTGGTTGTVPYDQTDDSGFGAASTTNATLGGQRRVDMGSSGPEHIWVFEDTNYWHAVIRRDTDIYEHFGSGYLTKYNDWTGGEYTYGHFQDNTFSSDTAIKGGTSILLDGLAVDTSPGATNMEERCATLHIEGMAEQTTEIWGAVLGAQSSSLLGVARDASARIHILGGFRGGMLNFPMNFGQFPGTIQRGLVPMYPIVLGYWDRTANEVYGPLGVMPDVRGVSLRNYANESEITVGSDTWVVFPSRRRKDADTSGAGYTMLQGIAYKQVS